MLFTHKPIPEALKAEYDALREKIRGVKESGIDRHCIPGREAEAEKINIEIAAFNEKLAAAGVRGGGFCLIEMPKPAEEEEEPATITETERKLVSMGLKVWKKAGRRRIYINREDFGKVFGLELDYYKTGSIYSAFLNGEKISNNKAYHLLGMHTPYYDCVADEWVDNKLDPII